MMKRGKEGGEAGKIISIGWVWNINEKASEKLMNRKKC